MHWLQETDCNGDAQQLEIKQLTRQYESLDPWACELEALQRTFEDHATRVKAAAHDLTANVASLEAAIQNYIQDLKHFQRVCSSSTHACIKLAEPTCSCCSLSLIFYNHCKQTCIHEQAGRYCPYLSTHLTKHVDVSLSSSFCLQRKR